MNTHDHHQQAHGHGSSTGGRAPEGGPPTAPPGTVKDPVCGMNVDPKTSPHHAVNAGTTYHFCSAGCRTKFVADAGKYLAPGPIEPAAAVPGAMYICPMHPEVRQDHPGTCPLCGMALEPEMPGLDDEANPELVDFSRRFWWTLPLTV
ncbi:MAG: YHS domain-containing protein, partial [Luteimonas sp.]|nr:YHS domain-containing protein [Luteimonas sp.]